MLISNYADMKMLITGSKTVLVICKMVARHPNHKAPRVGVKSRTITMI